MITVGTKYTRPPKWMTWVGMDSPDVTFDEESIQYHKHVMGVPGVGKSRWLIHYYLSLMDEGIAASFIDPHGDAVDDILKILIGRGYFNSPSADEKLLVFDWSDSEQDSFLPLNVIKWHPESNVTASYIRAWLVRVFPGLEEIDAVWFEMYTHYTIEVLAKNNQTLCALPRFLTDKDYRAELLKAVSDPDILRFFKDQLDAIKNVDRRLDRVGSSVSRIAIFMRSPGILYTLGQSEMALDFNRLIDDGIFALHSLSGIRDLEARNFIGSFLATGYEKGALSRQNTLRPRTPHHLIIDEAGHFASKSKKDLDNLLSEARKDNFSVTFAHQYWEQLTEGQRAAIQNCKVSIGFQQGSSDAFHSLKTLGVYDSRMTKDEPPTDRSHALYYSVPEQDRQQAQFLRSLPNRHAIVRVGHVRAHVVTPTVTVPENVTDADVARLKKRYKALYCKPKSQIKLVHREDGKAEDTDDPWKKG